MSCCSATTINQRQCLGLRLIRVVGTPFRCPSIWCGGVSLAPWCCLLCGGDIPARIMHTTAEECQQYTACPGTTGSVVQTSTGQPR
ncbi:hypothetical protein Q5P01_015819 [Channa striata]|uniref:Uncharacterized protein n=1 Tax=Channa striata TaxID=64152 RepID=A0AA88MCW0_CHASR|nr:hypothetical protein Q5P01_015819 [Channa striata]